MSEMKLSVVIPCYNEARTLPALLDRYVEVWRDYPSELVIVNNGSVDDTREVLARQLERPELAFARVVEIEQNRGYGHGIHTGLLAAQGEFLAWSHADMQTDPHDVFIALDELVVGSGDPEHTLVKGKRLPRDLGGELFTLGMTMVASTILMTRLSDVNAQPKVFHRDLLAHLTDPPDGIPYDLYVLYQARRAGFTICTIDVVFRRRAHGASRWAATFRSRWRTILNMLAFILRLRFRGS